MPDDASPKDPAVLTIDAALRRWRVAHREATFTEIEQAVDAQLREVRASLLDDLAGEDAAEGRCPACGNRLTRSYATCSACGHGLFPPR